jgi:chromosome segregation ATPase
MTEDTLIEALRELRMSATWGEREELSYPIFGTGNRLADIIETHFRVAEKELAGLTNKYNAAVNMAAQAENERDALRDELARMVKEISVLSVLGTIRKNICDIDRLTAENEELKAELLKFRAEREVARSTCEACPSNQAREIEELKAFLDEANAHLAWAEDDGKKYRKTVQRLVGDPDICPDGCSLGCGSDECIVLMVELANKEG